MVLKMKFSDSIDYPFQLFIIKYEVSVIEGLNKISEINDISDLILFRNVH